MIFVGHKFYIPTQSEVVATEFSNVALSATYRLEKIYLWMTNAQWELRCEDLVKFEREFVATDGTVCFFVCSILKKRLLGETNLQGSCFIFYIWHETRLIFIIICKT
jgi:hypothetical protein